MFIDLLPLFIAGSIWGSMSYFTKYYIVQNNIDLFHYKLLGAVVAAIYLFILVLFHNKNFNLKKNSNYNSSGIIFTIISSILLTTAALLLVYTMFNKNIKASDIVFYNILTQILVSTIISLFYYKEEKRYQKRFKTQKEAQDYRYYLEKTYGQGKKRLLNFRENC